MRGTGAKKKTKRRGGRRGSEGEEELEKRKNFWVAGSGGSHATKVRLGVIECLEVLGGRANMAKNFEKNSAKKEREVGASNLINFFGAKSENGLRPSQRGFFFFLDFFF